MIFDHFLTILARKSGRLVTLTVTTQYKTTLGSVSRVLEVDRRAISRDSEHVRRCLTDSLTLTKTYLSIKKWIKNEFKCTIVKTHVSPKWPKWLDFDLFSTFRNEFLAPRFLTPQMILQNCHVTHSVTQINGRFLFVTLSHFYTFVTLSTW